MFSGERTDNILIGNLNEEVILIPKEETTEENKEIEELQTERTTTFVESDIIDKLNELVREVNKLIRESK